MAISRRQFVTTLGALAASMGIGQADISKITEAFAHGSAWSAGGWANKPKVIWVHGAECTGCSTSLLSLFEDARAVAIEGTAITTVAALDLAVGGTGASPWTEVLSSTADVHPFAHRTVVNSAGVTGCDFDTDANPTGGNGVYAVNIADVLIDFIDLQYHETVGGMGGDLAYQWLADNMYNGSAAPFVLVVEGAVQAKGNGGYWNKTGPVPWCSIGQDDTPGADFVKNDLSVIDNNGEHSFDDVVKFLAAQAAATIAIGQCASYGGYPACKSPVLKSGMTDAKGVAQFLTDHAGGVGANKVINVPGCPVNPWWFILTVVAWLVDFTQPSRPLSILDGDGLPLATAVDRTGRLKKVFGTAVHGPSCPRYQDFLNGDFVTQPGGHVSGSAGGGCLQLIGCKGPSTKATCNSHGWNSLQPGNDATWESGLNALSVNSKGKKIGHSCIAAGAPCMGCTEKGYPDAFVPYVVR